MLKLTRTNAFALLAVSILIGNVPLFAATDAERRQMGQLGLAHKNEEGKKLCEEILRKHPNDYQALLNHGLFRFWNGESQAGIAEIEAVEKKFPNESAPHGHLGNIAFGSGQFEKALKLYDLCIQLDPTDGPCMMMRARALIGLKRFDEAERAVEQAASAERKGDPIVVDSLKFGFLCLRDDLSAAKDFTKAHNMQTLNYAMLLGPANELLSKGKFENAIFMTEKSPLDGSWLYVRVYAYTGIGDKTNAEKYCDLLFKQGQPEFIPLFCMASMYYRLGLPEKAAAMLRRMKKADYAADQAALDLAAQVHYEMRNYRECAGDLSRLLAVCPPQRRGEIHVRRADATYLCGNVPKALDDYTQAIHIDPQNPTLYRKRAELYRAMDNPGAADKDMDKAAHLSR